MAPLDLLRRLLLCTAAGVSLVFMVQAWDRLMGYVNYHQVEELKESWHEEDSIPHDRELNEGFKLGYRASEYVKSDSDYRFMLASLHAWREKGLRLWPNQANAETAKIIENLKAALAGRPSWHEAWILLALVKFQAGEIEHELRVALEKAIETGRYETAVHHGLAYISPEVWDELGPDLRGRIIETLRIALDNPNVHRFVVKRIVMTGKVELFRDKLESDEFLKNEMERHLKKLDKSL